jgi:hypothetical protein
LRNELGQATIAAINGARKYGLCVVVTAALVITAQAVQGADQSESNTPPGEVLLTDSLGRVVKVPTKQLVFAW